MASTITGTVSSPPRSGPNWLSVAPVALLVTLLLLATWFDGAFALRHWGPVAILALSIGAGAARWGSLSGGLTATRVAVLALCAYAGWTLLSASWADSPGRALEGGARTLLYAALFFVAAATPASPRVAVRLGGGLIAGVVLIGAITFADILGGQLDHFLAGRLDDPVGYRNATACLFAMAFWPLIAASAYQALNPLARAGAFGGGLLVLGLAFLTQSRGVGLGFLAGGVVALGLGPDRVRRAALAACACGAIALISDRLLAPYDAFRAGRPLVESDVAPATEALLLAVAAGVVVALAVALLDGGLRLGPATRSRLRRLVLGGLAVLALIAVGVTLRATGDPIAFAQTRFDEFRSLETAAPGESRLSFGGGQRADLWRVALDEFASRPVTGVGEGSYPFGYYRDRRNDRNLSTPHSLPFEIVSEKGAVGALLFLTFLGAVVVAVAQRWRHVDRGARWMASGLLALGTVALGQSLADWIWLVPGVTGLAFVALGLGLACLRPAGEDRDGRSRGWRIAGTAALALAVVLVTLVYVSDVNVRGARESGVAPEQRLRLADRAHLLNPVSIEPLYLQAGAQEDLGRLPRAREALERARSREPDNFVTLALLGDLELRAGRPAAARTWYRRAARLNPLDVGLRELAERIERDR